jgi:SAM-dependent methyltransferase
MSRHSQASVHLFGLYYSDGYQKTGANMRSDEVHSELDASQTEELEFWDLELRKLGQFKDVVERRLDPATRITEYPLGIFAKIYQHNRYKHPLKVLELGSGPISTLAYGVDNGQLAVTAIDILGDRYRELMDRLGLIYPILPENGRAEELDRRFPAGSFDCAFARNSLDHTEDLPLAFENIVRCVRPGGFILLMHAVSEGASNHWSASHKWNLDFGRTGLTATNKRGQIYLLEEGKSLELEYLSYASVLFGRWIDVLYRKTAY